MRVSEIDKKGWLFDFISQRYLELYKAKNNLPTQIRISEATIQRCSFEKVLWKYATNLQENTHAEVQLQ